MRRAAATAARKAEGPPKVIRYLSTRGGAGRVADTLEIFTPDAPHPSSLLPYDLLRVVARLYPQNPPRPFPQLEGVRHVRAGEDANQVRRSVDSTRRRLESLAAADDPVVALF